MVKHDKVAHLRQRPVSPHTEASVLLRSADSIGRVIGLLQRQIEQVSKRLAAAASGSHDGRRTQIERGTKAMSAKRSAKHAIKGDSPIPRVRRRSPAPAAKGASAGKVAGARKAPVRKKKTPRSK